METHAIQWITKETLDLPRQETFFAAITLADLAREKVIDRIVLENLQEWQNQGLVPNMEIEPGDETARLQRERGWTHWHHLFNARQLLMFSLFKSYALEIPPPELAPAILAVQSKAIEWNTRLCRWATSSRHENQVNTFSNQALNTLFNYSARAMSNLQNHSIIDLSGNVSKFAGEAIVESCPADQVQYMADIFVTDPPLAAP